MKAHEALIQESITLPNEIRNKEVKQIQISFLFDDGKMHHVKFPGKMSKIIAEDCIKDQFIHLENWKFLEDGDTEI
jgi:hypothetical protein